MTGNELIEHFDQMYAKGGQFSVVSVEQWQELRLLALLGHAAETAPVAGYIAVTSMGLHLNFEAITGDGAKELIVRPSLPEYKTLPQPPHD